MDVLDIVARELGLTSPDWQREVPLATGIRADAVARTPEAVVVVEITSRPARPEDIARLVLARHLLAREQGPRVVSAVLVAPAAGARVRHLAAEAEVDLLEVPTALLPTDAEAVGATPLTTPRSWSVVAALLRAQRVPGVRDLHRRTGVSLGWVSRIVRELEARGAVTRRGSAVVLTDVARVLDAVPSERPLKRLELARIGTGLQEPGDVALTLAKGLRETRQQGDVVEVSVCGTTAGAWLTGDLVQGDRFDVYGEPRMIERLLVGKRGGVEVHVHRPDRDIGMGATVRDGIPVVSVEQALLDTAGTGLAFRDVTLRLIEVMRDED